MLSIQGQQEIEHRLVESGKLTEQKLEALKSSAIQSGRPLLSLILEQKIISEEELTKITAEVGHVSYVNLSNVQVPSDILKLLPKATAESYMAVPFGRINGRLAVAMVEPTNVQAIDFIGRKTGQVVMAFQASRKSVDRVLGQYRADVGQDVSDVIDTINTEDNKNPKAKSKIDAEQVQTLVQDAPITRALNAILDYAAQSGASDIHIEPRSKELTIRYRIDGILQHGMTLPKTIEPALISRIKILSNLKIDEHRVPQDGQFQIHSGDKDIDLRIAISPVVYGEQVVIRLLDKTTTLLTLDSLGFRGRALAKINDGIHRPHGMTLATGPTGSGKSTTLYAIVQAINDASLNIVTLEDPVEYKMDGINQIQINTEVGLTFASGLRSVLRQDPNVVMVGEIRDKETADLATQAALTGHVVLSTLHTNSASGVLPRLLDMGIEPFLIASTVNTVIGQRLVRKICDKCKERTEATPAQIDSIKKVVGDVLPKTESDVKTVGQDLGFDNLPLSNQNAYTLYKGKGCGECVDGYKGRLGIQEVFAMTPSMEHLLSEHATTTQIQSQAQQEGMLTMQQDGYLKALVGLTTMMEVGRVASDY